MKRALLLLAVIGFVAAIGLICFRPNNQLTFQRRSIDSWLREYGPSPFGGGLIHDKFSTERPRRPGNSAFKSPSDAIRAIGTNAIAPLLIEIQHPDEPAWSVTAKRFINKLPWPKLQLRDAQSRREQAAVAFFDLGPAGVAAIPALTQLLTNYSSAVNAVHALAGMGTNAIPAFTAALINSNSWVRDCGAWGLAQIGAESRVAVPQILLELPKGNSSDQMLMLWALGQIREPVEIIRPELLSYLQHSDPQMRRFAAKALLKLGADAKPARDEIETALGNETDSETRTALKGLSKEINSEANSP